MFTATTTSEGSLSSSDSPSSSHSALSLGGLEPPVSDVAGDDRPSEDRECDV